MTGVEIAAIIGAAGTLITALGVAFVGIYAAIIAGRVKSQVSEVGAKVDEVHKLTNGLTERSNTAEREAGRAEGELTGRAAVKTEQGADALAREAAPATKPEE